MRRNFFTDERGNFSMARLLVLAWSSYLMVTWWIKPSVLDQTAVSTALSISLALIGWAGGSRVMSYLSPGITNAASAVQQRILAKSRPEPANVTTSTDIRELSEQDKG